MVQQVPPHPLVAAMIERRRVAGLGVRIVFNDGAPDFTGFYNSEVERDHAIARALRDSRVVSAEIIRS